MTRAELIKQVQRYFALRELIDEPTYNQYGDFAWNYWRTEQLETKLCLREQIFKRPMICNNWMMGGKFSQRGLRTNMSPLVLEKTKAGKMYMSAHLHGAGWDFDVIGMTADEARNEIQAKAHLLPYPIRLEYGVNWVHEDLFNDDEKNKVKLFKVG